MENSIALFLSRIQFAFIVSFHILFPAFTIGLADLVAVLEGAVLWRPGGALLRALRVLDEDLRGLLRHGRRVGHRDGLPVRHQLEPLLRHDRQRPRPADRLRGADRLLPRGGFLGVMLFGRERVAARLHFFATVDGGVGTLISAFWILAANSWMQTPAGYAIARRAVLPGRLVGDHLQPVLSLPPRPHGDAPST